MRSFEVFGGLWKPFEVFGGLMANKWEVAGFLRLPPRSLLVPFALLLCSLQLPCPCSSLLLVLLLLSSPSFVSRPSYCTHKLPFHFVGFLLFSCDCSFCCFLLISSSFLLFSLFFINLFFFSLLFTFPSLQLPCPCSSCSYSSFSSYLLLLLSFC